MGGQHLEPAGPAGDADTFFHVFRQHLTSKAVELLGRGNRQRQIAPLMATQQRRLHHDLFAHKLQWKPITACMIQSRRVTTLHPSGSDWWHVLNGAYRAGAAIDDGVTKSIVDLRMLREQHGYAAGTQNPRLFPSNLRQ